METELRGVLCALRILGPTSFSLADRIFQARHEDHLVEELEQCLYRHCYMRRFDGVPATQVSDGDGEDLTALLSAANCSRSTWSRGWKVEHVESGGRILARKGARLRRLWPGQYVAERGPDTPPAVDGHATVFQARESVELQEQFYFAFGETMRETESGARTLRFYFHVDASGAPALTREVTATLNRFQLPFRFKCLSASGAYGRRDAAVLYVDARHYRLASILVTRIHERCRSGLHDDTPLFARRLAPGLALAEDPVGEKSFGADRCRTVAEGICAAARRGAPDADAVMEEIAAAFRRRGLNPRTPWLQFSAEDPYVYPASCA